MVDLPVMCPHCGQVAPVVYRGMLAYCTACGKVRPPLTGTAVNLVGQPSRFGGTVARVLGWIALTVGGATGLVVLLVLQAIFPGAPAGWLVALPIWILSAVLGIALLYGGKSLSRSGQESQLAAREQAITALATNRGGSVTAQDVASSLELPLQTADSLLTDLAKSRPDLFSVDVDEQTGQLVYRLTKMNVSASEWRARVEASTPPTRVAPDGESEPLDAETEASVRARMKT